MISFIKKLFGRKNGRHVTLADLQRSAERGDAAAQFALAQAYLAAGGLGDTTRKAVNWLELAARAGHADAQYRLSLIYMNGLDIWPAAAWLAETANEKARANVRLLFPEGARIAPQPERAFILAEAAAVQSHAAAQAHLGMLTLRGIGCTQDFAASACWFERAAAQGDSGGDLGLGLLFEHGLGRAADPVEAACHYKRAAEAGNDAAATALGLMHLDGRIGRDLVKAERLLAGPAARGNPFAERGLQKLRTQHQGPSSIRTLP